jgi:hypothetical protein
MITMRKRDSWHTISGQASGFEPVHAKPTIEGETVYFSPGEVANLQPLALAGPLTWSVPAGRPPVVAYATSLLTRSKIEFVPHTAATEHVLLEPQLFVLDNTTLFGDLAIARFIGEAPRTSLST